MVERKPSKRRDILSDRFLLAYLIYRARGQDLGKTKIQKLVYLIESELAERSVKTFDYNFERNHFGPFAREINDDLKELVACDVLTTKIIHKSRRRTANIYEVTENGREIVEGCQALFEDNKELIDEIDKVLQKYDLQTLDDIKSTIYERKIELAQGLTKIKGIREGTKLNANVPEADSKNKLTMDEDWRETFCILFDKDECKSFNEGLKDAREGRFSACEVQLDAS
ncbi:MAG: type II toxin-antitoxin system antitoxin SocA domain-containing protein [Halobacteriota archaeon]